jgi:hypothetical protein
MYKVLWFDDEYETLEDIKENCLLKDIELIGFGNAKDGIKALNENYLKFDSVLLDGMFFNAPEQFGDVDDSAFGEVAIALSNLKAQGIIMPWFVYSGQKNFVKERSSLIDLLTTQAFANGKVFDKSLDEDLMELCAEIKKSANNQEITQLKHKYPNAFLLCNDNYLGSKEFARVLQLIKDIENPENISNQQDALLPMRKVLEAIFKKLNSIGLIPDEIKNGSGAINGASFFLAGNNKDYNYKEELIHPVIAESIRHLLGLTQDASHNEGSKLGADTYLSDSINSYLYQSLCFSLLEVLEYIKPFLDSNSDKKINQSKWELKETVFNSDDFVKGKITKVAENGKGTFESIQLSSTISVRLDLMKEYKLKEGSLITITTKPGSSKTSKFINEIMKVH